MKNILFITFFAFTLTNCSESVEQQVNKETLQKDEALPFNEKIVRHIESSLEIASNEKYTYKIYKENLDNDSILDAIVSVNRLDYALEEARMSGNSAKRAEIGFTGRYNFIFYFDGGLNKISPAIPVPSSPHAELTIDFISLFDQKHKDIIVDYTIMNSRFRNYFTVINHTPKQIFQWKLYDNLGETNISANFLEYGEGSYSGVKDILIFEGAIENSNEVEDIYNFKPVYKKSGKLLHRFFYLPKERKYFTNK